MFLARCDISADILVANSLMEIEPMTRSMPKTLARLEMCFYCLPDLGSVVLVILESLYLILIPNARVTVLHPLCCAARRTSYATVIIELAEAGRYIGSVRIDDHDSQLWVQQHRV